MLHITNTVTGVFNKRAIISEYMPAAIEAAKYDRSCDAVNLSIKRYIYQASPPPRAAQNNFFPLILNKTPKPAVAIKEYNALVTNILPPKNKP